MIFGQTIKCHKFESIVLKKTQSSTESKITNLIMHSKSNSSLNNGKTSETCNAILLCKIMPFLKNSLLCQRDKLWIINNLQWI